MEILKRMQFVLLLTLFTGLASFGVGMFDLLATIFVEEYDGSGVGVLLYVLLPCVAIGILVFDFAFPCPQCHKQLSGMPLSVMARKGFLFQYKRCFDIIRGKEIECMHCGWSAKRADGPNDGGEVDQ